MSEFYTEKELAVWTAECLYSGYPSFFIVKTAEDVLPLAVNVDESTDELRVELIASGVVILKEVQC